MPKIPYKPEKSGEDDADYEIVSFEDFCDKSPESKTDLLTLNDNINYRLCYESDKASKYAEGGESSRESGHQIETSLNGPKSVNFKRKLSNSFAPFGKYNPKSGRAPLFNSVLPKPRNDGESSNREHRYQRFSEQRNIFQRIWEHIPGVSSGVLGMALVIALCVGVWWAVNGALGGAWGDEQYRKLWERAHPDDIKKPLVPLPLEKPKVVTEYRYHDHNNLSTKNRSNSTEQTRRKSEYNKKNFYPNRTPDMLQDMCASVADNMKFDCLPFADEEGCLKRGCCWKPTDIKGAPYCYYPPQYDSFRFVNMTEDKHGMTVFYEKSRPSGYPHDFELVRIDFMYMSRSMLQIKINDAERRRFEPPYPDVSFASRQVTDAQYRVQVEPSTIGFKVVRVADNVTIFNTQDVGGLILSNKFLQISAVLPTDHVYGLGEKRSRFLNDMNYKRFAIFNRDRAPVEDVNLYGSHPFYLAVEQDGNSHGTLLFNSNAMDIVLQPTPAITYRTIGGILNFYIFMGPSPAEVVSQYSDLVGKTFMPPYWSLGFHLCKYNYGGLNATKKVWQSNRDAGIPFDVQWNDIDYMHDHNDFTYDTQEYAGLPDFIKQIHSEGMHYMIIIDPGIGASEKPGTYAAYDRGIEMDVFIKNSTNQPFVGKVWNVGLTVFPDFTHPNSTPYWVEMMTEFHKTIPFDGAWIDMNEPSNFVDGSVFGQCEPENLPYMPNTHDQHLNQHTLCMEAHHYAGMHYDLHNLYALTEAIATNFALQEVRGKRPFIISRSSFVGLGEYAGHWSGDIYSDWHDMKMTIPELLSFSIFGVAMMGADICGFNGNATPELCKRWMQLGAFYPFARNHNSDASTPQDPVSLGPEVVEASIKALRTRYQLLPYYYTLFWNSHFSGTTVARPLFFEWPSNTLLHDIDTQFMIGPSLIITPILEEGATTAKGYFPGPEKWYDFSTGLLIGKDEWKDVDDTQTVAIKAGTILPLQEPPKHGPVTTTNTRSCPLQLLIVPSSNSSAHGELYWDDGDDIHSVFEKKYSHIEFYLNGSEIRSTVVWWGYGVPSLNRLILFDLDPVQEVTVNGKPCLKACRFTYSQARVLEIKVVLELDAPFTVTWKYKKTTDSGRSSG